MRANIPVVTRLVQIYSEAEQRLAQAINRKDLAEIDRLVASDFELRSANNIGVPVPRAEWVEQSLKNAPQLTSIAQMAVHEYGDVRVVSFLMARQAAAPSEPAIAVVDVWVQSGETSVLKVRYAAAHAR